MNKANAKPLFNALFLLLAVIAFFLSFKLATDRQEFLSGQRTGDSICNISSFINCDAVAASEQATTFGVSNGALGLGFYAFLILMFFLSASPVHIRSWFFGGALFWTLLLSTLFGFYFMYLQLFVIRALCLFCTAVHLIDVLLLLAVALLQKPLLKERLHFPVELVKRLTQKNEYQPVLHQLGLAVIMALVFAPFIFWDKSAAKELAIKPEVLEKYQALFKVAPVYYFNKNNSATKGPDDAKVKIIEFSDFACPFCQRAAFISKAITHQFGDDTQLIFRHFPLDKDCNKAMNDNVHPYACEVARGSICAKNQNKFWPYHDRVFALKNKFNANTAKEVAVDVGLDQEVFAACLQSNETDRQLKTDIDEAIRAGVQSTPTVFINGRRFAGMLPAPLLKAIIEHLIATDSK